MRAMHGAMGGVATWAASPRKELLKLMKMFVGNLSWGTGDEELNTAFSEHGEVESANVVLDRETGRSRGFGFVEMANDDEARAAMQALDGSELDGRPIRVDESRPRTDR